MTISVQLVQIPESETVPRREYYMSGSEFVIGRDYDCDICLPDITSNISRRHVGFKREGDDGYTVSDLSTNGTTLNGKMLTHDKPAPLKDGDVIEFGGYKLLMGIVAAGRMGAENLVGERPEFEPETDFTATGPLLSDRDIEAEPVNEDRGFSQTEVALDPDLLFDPFAEGPAMNETETIEIDEESEVEDMPPAPAARKPSGSAARLPKARLSVFSVRDAEMQLRYYRDNVTEAMERTLDRFLDDIDPSVVQKDYDDFMSMFANRRKRYWDIHKKQFAKKKSNGDFRRMFLAMFAEEMRKR